MRAPGENPGMYAFESALDELSYKLKMDPVQLRLVNHADTNESTNQPYSSKYLKECYQVAGDKFGWRKRNPEPRSMRDGKLLVGMGMATATYPGIRSPGAAKVRILQDGSAMVASASQDMGGGTYTTMAQVVAEVTGIPFENVHSELGDSRMPPAPVSGGSMTTASILPAVKKAAEEALAKLIHMAISDERSPLHGREEDEVAAAHGCIFAKGSSPESGVPYGRLLENQRLAAVEGESTLAPGKERQAYAFQSFGAQFVEVKIDPEVARVTVSRVCSAFDVGRVINLKTARSQAYSGIIMGIGMALMEHTVYDHRDGGIVNSNLADYAVPVNADIQSDIACVSSSISRTLYIDDQGIGARGVGEIIDNGFSSSPCQRRVSCDG